jgi:hypothetical protein
MRHNSTRCLTSHEQSIDLPSRPKLVLAHHLQLSASVGHRALDHTAWRNTILQIYSRAAIHQAFAGSTFNTLTKTVLKSWSSRLQFYNSSPRTSQSKLITKLFYNNMCVPGVDKIIILVQRTMLAVDLPIDGIS